MNQLDELDFRRIELISNCLYEISDLNYAKELWLNPKNSYGISSFDDNYEFLFGDAHFEEVVEASKENKVFSEELRLKLLKLIDLLNHYKVPEKKDWNESDEATVLQDPRWHEISKFAKGCLDIFPHNLMHSFVKEQLGIKV